MANLSFKKAVKYEAKGRVGLIGPAGSGKSYTMLELAQLLAAGGKVAAVDTEHGSLSKYADRFDFDVLELSSYTPDNFLDALRAAEQAGYAVFCCDSLSHFWMGKDGALEYVDTAKKRSSSRDDMSGWKEFRPHERAMVDAMIASPCHIICTMRTKTAYEEQVNERTGKKQRVKIGLAPVQREGLEYEFDLVGLMDEDNTFIVDKTRCPDLSGKAITKPSQKDFAPFSDWLRGATSPAPASAPASASAPAARPAASAPSAIAAKLEGNQLTARVKDVLAKTTQRGSEYRNLIFDAAPVPGKGVVCWHASLFGALDTAPGELCSFRVEITEKYATIQDVLKIGDLQFREGKPFYENDDAEPELAFSGARQQVNPEITDDDIPF